MKPYQPPPRGYVVLSNRKRKAKYGEYFWFGYSPVVDWIECIIPLTTNTYIVAVKKPRSKK